jgi:hypothetical protein
MMTYRWIILLVGIFQFFAACDDVTDNSDDYVRTAKGDIVRKQDAEAANLPIRSESPEDESFEDEGGK